MQGGNTPSRCPVEGFLRDAAYTGLSMWTVANVLRCWVADGTRPEEITLALDRVRTSTPASQAALLDDYESAINNLLK